jgi:hypothetical protein
MRTPSKIFRRFRFPQQFLNLDEIAPDAPPYRDVENIRRVCAVTVNMNVIALVQPN